MTDLQRQTTATIVSWVVGENWSMEQLNAILRFMNAMQWSEETDKIARAFDGLVKEIIHRDTHAWSCSEPARPWENLLSSGDRRIVEKAIQNVNDGRVF